MSRYQVRSAGRLSSIEMNRYQKQMEEILADSPRHGAPVDPAQLLGHVYIGSQDNAESYRLLRRLGITHVLNCAGFKGVKKNPELKTPYEGLDIDYLEFKADDKDTYDISKHFNEAFSYLDNVSRKGGICLVHCAMGINRSAAICVAYMMYSKRWPLLKVLKVIRRLRSVVLSNKGFQWRLLKFAQSEGLLDKLEAPTETVESVRRSRASLDRDLPGYSSVSHRQIDNPERNCNHTRYITRDRCSDYSKPPLYTSRSKVSTCIPSSRSRPPTNGIDILGQCIEQTLSMKSAAERNGLSTHAGVSLRSRSLSRDRYISRD